MTRDEAVAYIQQGCSWRTNLNDAIANALKQAQAELEKGTSLPLFLLEEDDTLTLTSGTRSVAMPTGYLRPYEWQELYYTDSDGVVRYPVMRPLQYCLATYGSEGTGAPVVYARRKGTFEFFPTPNAAYVVTLSYYKADSTLDSGSSENLWMTNFPYLLCAKAGMTIARDTRDAEALGRFQELYTIWERKYIGSIAMEELDGGSIALGENQ